MKKNSEKAILAVCAIAGLGLAYMGYAKSNSVETEFEISMRGNGKNDVSIPGSDKLAKTLESVAKPLLLEQGKAGERPVDNFVGVALFAKKPAGGDAVAEPVDPVLDAPIHPPIDNQWWLTYNIDPGFGDSPSRDQDKDGFSNLEEFKAKSDPTDPKSFPDLVEKLVYAKYESVGYFLWFTSSLGANRYQFKVAPLDPAFEVATPPQQEAYLNSDRVKYTRTRDFIAADTNIFDEGFGKDRFKLKKVEIRKMKNAATNSEEDKEFATIEDLAPNKKEEFEIPRSPRSKERAATVRYDRTAVLSLDAIGEEGKEFKVQENTTFALPEGKGEKKYLLKSVSSTAIVVEYKDAQGKTQTREIKKN